MGILIQKQMHLHDLEMFIFVKSHPKWRAIILFILLVFPTLDQTSPQHIGEINDPGEAPASQVLHAAKEQLEQDILQPLDVDAPAEDDSMDELDNGTNNKCMRIRKY